MREFRLLRTGFKTAFENMAIDEAVMRKISESEKFMPTIRIYGWRPAAVSIGYFQGMNLEVDVGKCRSMGIDVIRRVTGGGAVFHDNELTYSFITKEDDSLVPKDILESYKVICAGLTKGLGLMGINASFVPLNDISANEKKISGNAQTRREHCVLQHGTLLLDVDVDRMFSVLKVPDEKMKGKMIAAVKERVTSAKHILGREVSFKEAEEKIIAGFEQALSIRLVPGELSEEEKILAERLAKEKYKTREWNFRR